MTSQKQLSRRQALGALAGVGAASSSSWGLAAQSVGPALGRPAVPTLTGERAVLLGAAAAGQRLLAVGERGLLLSSNDQGQHWQQMASPVSVTLTALSFANAQQGLAVGHGGTVLATQDGGQHWQRRLDGLQLAALELAAARALGDAVALRSAQRLQADGADKPLLDVLLLDAQRAVVIGAYGLCFASTDAGQHWTSWRQRLDNPKELHLYAVRRRGEQLLIVGERGLVLFSNNLGQRFRRLSLPYSGSFFTAELPADGSLLVAGLRGNVWRSTDAGASWIQLASPSPASITSSALVKNGVLLGTQAGQVLLADAQGLHAYSPSALPPLNALLPLASGDVLALTLQGIERLRNLPR